MYACMYLCMIIIIIVIICIICIIISITLFHCHALCLRGARRVAAAVAFVLPVSPTVEYVYM